MTNNKNYYNLKKRELNMSNFFNVIFTSFIFLTFSSFKSLAINILEKTEYYECGVMMK